MAGLEQTHHVSQRPHLCTPKCSEVTHDESLSEQAWAVGKDIAYLDEVFKISIGVATFGGTITFTLILTDIREPVFMTRPTVQGLLAISWLLFIAALGIAAIMKSLLKFYGQKITREFQGEKGRRKWNLVDKAVSLALGVALLGAFFAASVVVMAYVKAVGGIGVLFTVLALIVWVSVTFAKDSL